MKTVASVVLALLIGSCSPPGGNAVSETPKPGSWMRVDLGDPLRGRAHTVDAVGEEFLLGGERRGDVVLGRSTDGIDWSFHVSWPDELRESAIVDFAAWEGRIYALLDAATPTGRGMALVVSDDAVEWSTVPLGGATTLEWVLSGSLLIGAGGLMAVGTEITPGDEPRG